MLIEPAHMQSVVDEVIANSKQIVAMLNNNRCDSWTAQTTEVRIVHSIIQRKIQKLTFDDLEVDNIQIAY